MFILPLNCGLCNLNFLKRAQQLLRWATVPEQSGPKSGGGGCCAPFRGGAGSPSNTISPGPCMASVRSGILIHPVVWPQTWAEKWGAAVPLSGRAGSPSNTMWHGPRPNNAINLHHLTTHSTTCWPTKWRSHCDHGYVTSLHTTYKKRKGTTKT